MGFSSGSVSFRRFAVIGQQPVQVDGALLEKLGEHVLVPGEFGVPEEIEYGWSGGRHVLDDKFSFEHNVFADCLIFALRIDTNRVPSSLKQAWQMMEEEATAAGNPSGFISKSQKQQVKESIRGKMEEELRSGRHRRSKLLPILWDLPSQTLYCNASSTAQEKLAELFERSLGLELQPLGAGSTALRMLQRGRRRDYEDLKPTRFAIGPDGESQWPEYPWVSKGPEPKDFLGNEMLLWLWHEAESKDGAIMTESAGEITVMIDKSLDLDCAYGQSGRDGLRGSGPNRMPEARDGLRSGKVPRKMGLILEAQRQTFSLTWSAESLAVGAAQLPEVEEADSPRTLLEERVALLRDLSKSLDALVERFLKLRTSGSWEGYAASLRKWILQPVRPVATAVA